MPQWLLLSPKPSFVLSGQPNRRPTDAKALALPTPCLQRTCSAGQRAKPAGKISARAGEIISEIADLLRRHWRHHVGHRGVIAGAGIALVFCERFGEVVLALVGNARDVFLAGKISVVAVIAAVLIGGGLPALHPRGIAGIGRRRGLWQFGDEVREGAQV